MVAERGALDLPPFRDHFLGRVPLPSDGIEEAADHPWQVRMVIRRFRDDHRGHRCQKTLWSNCFHEVFLNFDLLICSFRESLILGHNVPSGSMAHVGYHAKKRVCRFRMPSD